MMGLGIVHKSISRSKMHLTLILTSFNAIPVSGICACLDYLGMGGGDVQPEGVGIVYCSNLVFGIFGTSDGVKLPSLTSISIVAGSALMLPTVTSIVSIFDVPIFVVVPEKLPDSPLSSIVVPDSVHWRIQSGGVPGTHHPLQDPILPFSHSFLLKSVKG